MSESHRVLRVGLTGGIASGKTTVAGFLSELGAFVLDADRIGHELLAPGGGAVDAVAARFGRDVLAADGGIDREALGKRVFGDPEGRKTLEAIVHPGIRDEIERRIVAHARSGTGSGVAIVDAALLVETGQYKSFDRLIVLRCERDTQLRRLEARGLTEAEAEARLGAQAPLETKLAAADYVIDTETETNETRQQTEQVWTTLLADAESLQQESRS